MPVALYTPRVNNNDDTVRLSHLFVESGAYVKAGDPIADVETDKATFTVEAESNGYVLSFNAQKGDTIAVGSILAWIGSSATEAIAPAAVDKTPKSNGRTTLKAALLLARYGLDASAVPASAERLSVEDVERHIATRGLDAKRNGTAQSKAEVSLPGGKSVEFTSEERGMLRTVEWHAKEAVPAYLEIQYDDAPWHALAAEFQKEHKLFMSPLLSLLAWKLVQVAQAQPLLNATVNGGQRYEYDAVNLGFTVQAGSGLYVAVVQNASALSQAEFVTKLGDLQRRAMKGDLKPEETSGATVCFSSMSRWAVVRHMPILMPYTSLMVAHAAPRESRPTLGATYDHRVLSGGAVAVALTELSRP